MNRPNSIGIIGGAGPMAGVLFHRKIIHIAQTRYGCKQDADFPFIVHLGFPFTDMLSDQREKNKGAIQEQLRFCFDTFNRLNIEIVAIACNTLHAYLDTPPDSLVHLIHLSQTKRKELNCKKTLVFCTSTSRANRLYDQIFEGVIYPDAEDQQQVDKIIHAVVEGVIQPEAAQFYKQCMEKALKLHPDLQSAILGCTEISELHDSYPITHPTISLIDPMQLLAEKVCLRSFCGKTDFANL